MVLHLDAPTVAFVRERHLASLTLVRPDGRPHVTPVGFTWDSHLGVARVITWNASVKARILEAAGPLEAALCQVEGGRWLTIAGLATVTSDPEICADAVARYAQRYSTPKDRGSDRRVIEVVAQRSSGRV